MGSGEMLNTALAVVKALQSPPAPLTVNGVVYDGTRPVELSVGSLPIVDTVEEMTDQQRQYVSQETGTVWQYRYHHGYTNALPAATGTPDSGEICGEGGWLEKRRLGAGDTQPVSAGTVDLSGYIPAVSGDVIYMWNVDASAPSGTVYGSFLWMFDAAGVNLGYVEFTKFTTAEADGIPVYSTAVTYGDTAYIRLQLKDIREGSVITVNQPYTAEETGWRWTDTGVPYGFDSVTLSALESRTGVLEADSSLSRQRITALERERQDTLPAWWEDYLPGRMAAIRAHQDLGGRDAFSFAVMSDIHENYSLGRRTGAVAKRVMEGCGIRFAVDLGDFSTRVSVDSRADMEASMEEAAAILAPIGSGLLRTQGNHDGAWGNEGGTYVHNYSGDELYNRVFRQVDISNRPHFDADGVGYYLDDEASRARFVVLNTHHTRGARNYFNYHRYGQSQFDLMAEALTTVPGEDWCVLFFSHAVPVTGVDYDEDGVEEVSLTASMPEQGLLRRLVAAYMRREPSYSDSYGSEGDWDAVTLSGVNFSAAKGQFAGYFAGHFHGDTVYGVDDVYPFPVITVRSDAPVEKHTSQQAEPRAAGSYTEHSFDVVTVVRTGGGLTLYLDKIGAGADRVIRVEA